MTVMEYPLAMEHRQRLSLATNRPERRYLTIMICDLVNSTRLACKLDPEDLLQLVEAYRHLCVAIIRRHDGFVANFTGDGIMAFFGYPRTREDDAERAVATALDVLSAINARKSAAAGTPWSRISIRIGIASGLVVLGNPRETVIGETPNLAARLQGVAQPGTIIISNETRSLIRNVFRLKDGGPYSLRGYEKSLRLWQVLSKAKPGLPATPASPAARCRETDLVPLSRLAAAAFIRRLAGSRRLPVQLTEEILTRGDGIPLFLTELTRMALDVNVPGKLNIPARVRALLMARLDRQPFHARYAAQVGATLGRTFSPTLIRTLWPYRQDQLEQALDTLCRSEVLVKEGAGGNIAYRFKWALMQEVAYQGTLKQVRINLLRQLNGIIPVCTGETK